MHDLVAAALERSADELFVGVRSVDLGGVDEGDAEVERPVDRADRLGVVAAGAGVGGRHAHRPEPDAGHLEVPQLDVLHVVLPFGCSADEQTTRRRIEGVPVERGTARDSLPASAGRTVDGVDARQEIRDFLVSRAGGITPEQAGLSAFGRNRRVTGLRREEVALLAGISVEYYTRLERGNATGVSEDVLEAIARALQLDEAERAHLFDLVRTVEHDAGAAAPAEAGTGPADGAAHHRRDARPARPTSATAVSTSSPPTGSAPRSTRRCSPTPCAPSTSPGSSS